LEPLGCKKPLAAEAPARTPLGELASEDGVGCPLLKKVNPSLITHPTLDPLASDFGPWDLAPDPKSRP